MPATRASGAIMKSSWALVATHMSGSRKNSWSALFVVEIINIGRPLKTPTSSGSLDGHLLKYRPRVGWLPRISYPPDAFVLSWGFPCQICIFMRVSMTGSADVKWPSLFQRSWRQFGGVFQVEDAIDYSGSRPPSSLHVLNDDNWPIAELAYNSHRSAAAIRCPACRALSDRTLRVL